MPPSDYEGVPMYVCLDRPDYDAVDCLYVAEEVVGDTTACAYVLRLKTCAGTWELYTFDCMDMKPSAEYDPDGKHGI